MRAKGLAWPNDLALEPCRRLCKVDPAGLHCGSLTGGWMHYAPGDIHFFLISPAARRRAFMLCQLQGLYCKRRVADIQPMTTYLPLSGLRGSCHASWRAWGVSLGYWPQTVKT